MKCFAKTIKNERCKRNEAIKGCNFCNLHLNLIFNVNIKKSNIPNAGNGLFAGEKGFKKNKIIGEYSRYDIKGSYNQLLKKCKKDKLDINSHQCVEYFYCDQQNDCYDARTKKDIYVRYANDSRNINKNNAEFVEYGGRVFMIASKNIKPYEEIFCDYGDNYDWDFN